MQTKPKIIISEDDCDRIESLISHLKPDQITTQLLEELGRADIVTKAKIPNNVVKMHSNIKFTVLSTNKTLTYKLVYPNEKVESNDLSILTPMGSALLGLSIGSEIEWPIDNRRSMSVRIDDVFNE